MKVKKDWIRIYRPVPFYPIEIPIIDKVLHKIEGLVKTESQENTYFYLKTVQAEFYAIFQLLKDGYVFPAYRIFHIYEIPYFICFITFYLQYFQPTQKEIQYLGDIFERLYHIYERYTPLIKKWNLYSPDEKKEKLCQIIHEKRHFFNR